MGHCIVFTLLLFPEQWSQITTSSPLLASDSTLFRGDLVLFLFLFQCQFLRRTYESLFITKFSPRVTSLQASVFGMFTAACWIVLLEKTYFCFAAFYFYFCSVLGPVVEVLLERVPPERVPLISFKHFLAVALFAWSRYVYVCWLVCGTRQTRADFAWLLLFSYHQYRCHKILADLRPSTAAAATVTSQPRRYSLPQGDWFELVSCPHYFAEILIYSSLLLVLTNVSMWYARVCFGCSFLKAKFLC